MEEEAKERGLREQVMATGLFGGCQEVKCGPWAGTLKPGCLKPPPTGC